MRFPEGMIHVRPKHAIELVASLRPDEAVHLIELEDPTDFVAKLPANLQPPAPGRTGAGLPPNAWCGVVIDGYKSQKAAERLLQVRSRISWVYFVSGSWRKTLELFEAWRCERCGRRGGSPRPKKCPHVNFLCSDAKLLPQIQWLILDPAADPLLGVEAKKLGVIVYPVDVPEVHALEMKEAARRRDRGELKGIPLPKVGP